MIYQRHTVGSLDKWADETGDPSYVRRLTKCQRFTVSNITPDFDNFLPYFKKSPRFTPPGPYRASNATTKYNAAAFASTGGPLHVHSLMIQRRVVLIISR